MNTEYMPTKYMAEVVLAAIQRMQANGLANHTEQLQKVYAHLATAPAITPPAGENTHRWNIERDGNDLLICDGEHEKSVACNYVRYTPALPAVDGAVSVDAECCCDVCVVVLGGGYVQRMKGLADESAETVLRDLLADLAALSGPTAQEEGK